MDVDGGANVVAQKGVYGTLGTAAAGNVPGAREFTVTWTDTSGNFWLFGGEGLDSAGTIGALNDLWKYAAGQWTWMGGSNVANQKGTYGTLGTPAPGNVPGARKSAVTWIDASGNLWLFGGGGYDSAGTVGALNDLWKYSTGQWTWMGGSNVANQKGVYGTLGTAAASNVPGARGIVTDTSTGIAVTWTDASGNLWLFGGDGYDSTGTQGFLNDLWKYSAGQWTWMGGSNVANQKGAYGTQGTNGPNNVPGHDLVLLVGPMRPEISGSSVGVVTTPQGQRDSSTTCGSTSPRVSERHARRQAEPPAQRPDELDRDHTGRRLAYPHLPRAGFSARPCRDHLVQVGLPIRT
jgi:hypothetical protein